MFVCSLIFFPDGEKCGQVLLWKSFHVIALHVWFCCFFDNTVLLCIYVREGRVKETCFVFRSQFTVVLSCWEVNSHSLLWLLRKLGVSHWNRNEL